MFILLHRANAHESAQVVYGGQRVWAPWRFSQFRRERLPQPALAIKTVISLELLEDLTPTKTRASSIPRERQLAQLLERRFYTCLALSISGGALNLSVSGGRPWFITSCELFEPSPRARLQELN